MLSALGRAWDWMFGESEEQRRARRKRAELKLKLGEMKASRKRMVLQQQIKQQQEELAEAQDRMDTETFGVIHEMIQNLKRQEAMQRTSAGFAAAVSASAQQNDMLELGRDVLNCTQNAQSAREDDQAIDSQLEVLMSRLERMTEVKDEIEANIEAGCPPQTLSASAQRKWNEMSMVQLDRRLEKLKSSNDVTC